MLNISTNRNLSKFAFKITNSISKKEKRLRHFQISANCMKRLLVMRLKDIQSNFVNMELVPSNLSRMANLRIISAPEKSKLIRYFIRMTLSFELDS